MISNFRAMGVLRNGLHMLALSFALLMPFAQEIKHGSVWNLFFEGVLPALSPLIVIIIGLDIMMSSIWRSEAEADRVEHFNRIIRTHWIVGGILFLSWLTAFLPVLL